MSLLSKEVIEMTQPFGIYEEQELTPLEQEDGSGDTIQLHPLPNQLRGESKKNGETHAYDDSPCDGAATLRGRANSAVGFV